MAKRARKKKKSSFSLIEAVKNIAQMPWLKLLGYLTIILITTGIIVGFFYLNRYVNKKSPVRAQSGPMELTEAPVWISQSLMEKIAQTAGGTHFMLDHNTAPAVAHKLQTLPWLYNVKVRLGQQKIFVNAKFRKPIAYVNYHKNKYYCAWAFEEKLPKTKDVVILDYLPITDLNIIQITGFNKGLEPAVGAFWRKGDVTAAMEILSVMAKMDKIVTEHKPLLSEISEINVANFQGRENTSAPHIVLTAKDGTEIYFGAAIGQGPTYLEPKASEKISMLYNFFKEEGTIQDRVKCIELQVPQNRVPSLLKN